LRLFVGLFFYSLLLLNSANAASSTKQLLDKFFTDLNTLSANFEQVVQNSQLNATENASGRLWIQRPGKFRWNYDLPYLQEIVSDGEKVWIYDADLEQVTIKKVNKTLGNTPALLLSNNAPLEESFIIQEMDKGLSLSWIALLPKDSEAGFTSIRLGFDENLLKQMILEDNLGQTTRLTFSSLKRNIQIDSNLFNFVPPKNADIFDSSN
jgi:outer membrane lipoprotein carrier protein